MSDRTERRWRHAAARLLAAAILTLLTLAPAAAQELRDPLEPVNRAIFRFNNTLDRYALEPVARGYRKVAPQPVRRSVRNFLSNLRSPVVFANDVLQGERDRAGVTLARFMINTTLGVAGLFDAASTFGYTGHSEDFGQTLGSWGVDSGPFLMLPLIGPSTTRDTAGLVGDYFADPLNLCCIDSPERWARRGSEVVSDRETNLELVEDARRSSIDLYSTVRSAYAQNRRNEILNGRAPPPGSGNGGLFDDPAAGGEVFEDPATAPGGSAP